MQHEYARADSVRDVFRVDLRFEELGLELANGVRVLNGVNGEIRHGRLTVRARVWLLQLYDYDRQNCMCHSISNVFHVSDL